MCDSETLRRYSLGIAANGFSYSPFNDEPYLHVNVYVFHLTSKCKWAYSIGMANREQSKTDVLQGTLDLMVLQTLGTLGALHGYAIAKRLEQVSSGAVRLNMGTLYPSLMRLEQRGFVRGAWDVTENNRKARFYSITASGRRQLATQRSEWDRTVSIMHAVLGDQG